jgi:hypothetical protein
LKFLQAGVDGETDEAALRGVAIEWPTEGDRTPLCGGETSRNERRCEMWLWLFEFLSLISLLVPLGVEG